MIESVLAAPGFIYGLLLRSFPVGNMQRSDKYLQLLLRDAITCRSDNSIQSMHNWLYGLKHLPRVAVLIIVSSDDMILETIFPNCMY